MTDYREIMGELGRLQARIHELERTVAREARSEASTVPQEGTALVCAIGDERMAFDLSHIEEVSPSCALTAFPQAPAWHLGLLNLRGEMLPVLDVAARLGRPARRMALSDCIVIARVRGRRIGLLVEQVCDIIELRAADVQDVSVDVPEAPYVLGTLHYRERGVFLVDLPALIETSRLLEASDVG